jgi:hypothetical protein
MQETMLQRIDQVVEDRKLVVSGDDETMVAIVQAAIVNDVSASFYLTPQQAEAIKVWYWTPERIKITGLKPISYEEEKKIKTELGVRGIDNFRFAPHTCECGHTYGAFEFFQQGVALHGLEAVNAVFSLRNSTLFQVNPRFIPICPECGRALRSMASGPRNAAIPDLPQAPPGGIYYDCDKYGGCCCCAAEAFQ